jgi:hypothetical protein
MAIVMSTAERFSHVPNLLVWAGCTYCGTGTERWYILPEGWLTCPNSPKCHPTYDSLQCFARVKKVTTHQAKTHLSWLGNFSCRANRARGSRGRWPCGKSKRGHSSWKASIGRTNCHDFTRTRSTEPSLRQPRSTALPLSLPTLCFAPMALPSSGDNLAALVSLRWFDSECQGPAGGESKK